MKEIKIQKTIFACIEPTYLKRAQLGEDLRTFEGDWVLGEPLVLRIESETGDPKESQTIPLESLIPYLGSRCIPWGECDDEHLAAARAMATALEALADRILKSAHNYEKELIQDSE